MIIPADIYDVVVRSMPIPCVDVMPIARDGQVLLVRRAEEPARDEWWFPGGRVHYGETRKDAARRKLREECGLAVESISDHGTYELFFTGDPDVHGITTVLFADVAEAVPPTLDNHAEDARWMPPDHWLAQALHPFVRARIEEAVAARNGAGRA